MIWKGFIYLQHINILAVILALTPQSCLLKAFEMFHRKPNADNDSLNLDDFKSPSDNMKSYYTT